MANSVNFSRPSKSTIPLKVQLASKGDHYLTCNSSSPLELNKTTFEWQPKQSTSLPKWATCQVNRLRPRTFHIQNAIHLRRALRGSCIQSWRRNPGNHVVKHLEFLCKTCYNTSYIYSQHRMSTPHSLYTHKNSWFLASGYSEHKDSAPGNPDLVDLGYFTSLYTKLWRKSEIQKINTYKQHTQKPI